MVTIRSISSADAEIFKVVRLQALLDSPTAFGGTYDCESRLADEAWLDRAARCASEACIGYLAMNGDAACGIVRATPDDDVLSVAWVESMWVAPSHRRTGVGRALIGKIFDWARRRGIVTLKLSVTNSNEPAIRFYRKLGFCATGRTEPYPNDPALVECEMSLQLSE